MKRRVVLLAVAREEAARAYGALLHLRDHTRARAPTLAWGTTSQLPTLTISHLHFAPPRKSLCYHHRAANMNSFCTLAFVDSPLNGLAN